MKSSAFAYSLLMVALKRILAHAKVIVAAAAIFLHQPSLASSGANSDKTQAHITDYHPYILGPGDKLAVDVYGLADFSGTYTIGPDGTLYLPRIRNLYAEGLTTSELQIFLTDQFKAYLKNPEVYVSPVSYRPVSIYVGGEVQVPGYYSFNIEQSENGVSQLQSSDRSGASKPNIGPWPTLFDAVKAAQGITPFSDLTKVTVIRKRPAFQGGGKIYTDVDFFSFLTGESQTNIKLFDGDIVKISRSQLEKPAQLYESLKSNISPRSIVIYLSGRLNDPGIKNLPQGTSLNQAIASAGGPRLLRGGVSFLRLYSQSNSDYRRFSYKPSAKVGSYENPVLMTGDIVRIDNSLLSTSFELLNEITTPALGVYSLYNILAPSR